MNYTLSELTKDRISTLLKDGLDHKAKEEVNGARQTGTQMAFVYVVSQVDEFPMYSGLPTFFLARDRTWEDTEALAYVIHHEFSTLQIGKTYPCMMTGDYQDRPVYVTFDTVEDCTFTSSLHWVEDVVCTGGSLQVTEREGAVIDGEFVVDGGSGSGNPCVPYLSSLTYDPVLTKEKRYFRWTSSGLEEGPDCDNLSSTNCFPVVRGATCTLVDIGYVAWHPEGFEVCYARCPGCCAPETQMSVTNDDNGIKLVGDESSPAASNYYGTNAVGTLGYHDIPVVDISYGDTNTVDLTETGTTITADVNYQMSIDADASGLKLVNDDVAPGNNQHYGTDSSGIKGWYANTSGYTDEQAQDAVGGILVDSDTIDFGYDDVTPEIEARVITQMSVTADASGVKLVHDESGPSASKYYGTSSGGTLGYHALPSVPSAATQAEQETGSSTSVYTSPGRQHFHTSAAKAWVQYHTTTSTAVDSSYNVASLTDHGTGDTTITWTTGFSSANYCVVCACRNDTVESICIPKAGGTITTTTVRVDTVDRTGSIRDCDYVTVVAFGDQ